MVGLTLLKVCYDLAHSPPTFDFVACALWAHAQRLARSEKEFGFIISPGPADGFRRDSLWPHSVEERNSVLKAIVEPMAWMVPRCQSVEFRKPGKDEAIGYGRRTHGLDVYAQNIAPRPLRPRVELDRTDRVTITLREAAHWPHRNSDLPNWISAARQIKAMGHDVVFVRDTLLANEPIDGFETSPDASFDLERRASLYRSSYCNLFVGSGPSSFSIALNAPTLIFRPIADDVKGCFSARYFEDMAGIKPGGQFSQCPPHQRMIWDKDRADVIIEAFKKHQT